MSASMPSLHGKFTDSLIHTYIHTSTCTIAATGVTSHFKNSLEIKDSISIEHFKCGGGN